MSTRHPVSAPVALAALGVVFGDIGTSPLYTLATCYSTVGATPNAGNTLGILSLIFWALVVVVCIKYVTFLMRVDHEGEGGILALLAIAAPPRLLGTIAGATWLIPIVVIGAAMLIGDGMITPAISVISAVEGLDVVTKAAHPFIVPISLAVLLGLFLIQSRGTQRVGSLFGPFMLLWFLAIGIAGANGIFAHPGVLVALNPAHAAWFVTHHGAGGFLIFGAVILCLTGAEALYADLSHFGRIPITWAWYCVVLPALVLNYFGQGAYLIVHPSALESPFYALTPGWTLIPMVVLATLATVIASQALISGAFTLCEQAIAMNLAPRMKVMHTSQRQRGQVFIPLLNVILTIGCLALVLVFRSSARLAGAYGLAVACTMLATTIAYFVVATKVFGWKKRFVLPIISIFAVIDTIFVLSGLPKIVDGAWVPIAISAVIATMSFTWLHGRRALARALTQDQLPMSEYLELHKRPEKPEAIAVLLSHDPSGVPFVRNHEWVTSFLCDKTLVLLHLEPAARPYVEQVRRLRIERIEATVFIMHAAFGYMETPSMRRVFSACEPLDFDISNPETAFFFAAPVITARSRGGMRKFQRALYMWLARISRSIVDDLDIPPKQRAAIGVEVSL